MQQENGGESCVASSWFCNVSVLRFLVETEKNAHTQSSFAVTIFLSSLTGSELCLFKNPIVSQSVSQSVRRRLTKLRFREFFVFTLSSFSSVFMDFYCIYGLSVSR